MKGQFQMIKENIYRTVSCGELREENIGQQVRVAGWVENIRDHGGVMFLDIRDEYGVLQVVVHDDALLKNINKECTVTLSGEVVKRDEETINRKNSKLRVRVEHVFGFMEECLHGMYSRVVGFARNAAYNTLTNLVYNLCRYEQVMRLGTN